MNVITGVVESLNDKQGQGKFGPWTKRSFNVNGEWYGNFITKENKGRADAVKEGDAVKLAFVQKGEFKNWTDIEVIAKHEPVTGFGLDKAAVKGDAPVPYNREDKDWRITFQSGLKCAVPFVDMLLKHDLIPLGTKKEKKVDICFELVTEYARQFAEASFNPREVKQQENEDESASEGVE